MTKKKIIASKKQIIKKKIKVNQKTKVKTNNKIADKKKIIINKKPTKKIKKEKIVAVSGGFDPVHIGHIRMFNEAKAYGDKLIVILNNDNWLRKKKGKEFMPEHERKEIIEAFESVDEVVITEHSVNAEDMSVCNELKKIKPHIFANGGDRHADNVPEVVVCKDINCVMVYGVGKGGKVQSSSWLLEGHKEYKERKSSKK